MDKRTFWMALLVCSVSMVGWGNPDDPVSGEVVPFLNATIEAEYVTRDIVNLKVTGDFPATNYQVGSLTYEIENNLITVSMTIEQTAEVGATILVPVEQIIQVEPLRDGAYAAFLEVNGTEMACTKFRIDTDPSNDPNPEPTPIPVPFNLSVTTEPEHPSPNEQFSVYINGEFPSPGYTFVKKELAIAESLPEILMVQLEIQEPTEQQPAVKTGFRELVGTASISAGWHPVYIILDGQRVHSMSILVGDDPYELLVEFTRSGGFAGVYETLMLTRNGIVEVHSSAVGKAQISEASMEEILDLIDAVPFDTLEPSYAPDPLIADGYGYTLCYKQNYKVSVEQGADAPAELLKLIERLERLFTEIPSNDPTEPKPSIRAIVEIDPSHPAVGQEFSVYVVGVFPTPGYVFTLKELAILKSNPDPLQVNVEIQAPSEPQPEVETRFRELIGTKAFLGGFHEVVGILNGVEFYRGRFAVGEVEQEDSGLPRNASTNTFGQPSPHENGLQITNPGAPGDMPVGEVWFGEIPADEGYTDGIGLTARLDPGEGLTLYGDPVIVDKDYVLIRMAVRTDGTSATIGLGGLDADAMSSYSPSVNGTMGMMVLTEPTRILNRFGYLETIFKSERGEVIPVFQVTNSEKARVPVTVYFDNLEIYRIPEEAMPDLTAAR
ncbi:MAG TPA: hypothetical protein PK395_15005 [bacterium]|nr:hypothetical protein [bacterium]HQP99509.1 hypothetical protein [bacterium]